DIEPFISGDGFDALAHVFARVVDDFLSAILAYGAFLRGGAHGGNDPCAEQVGEGDASEANPAGGARHEDRFVGLESSPFNQGNPGRGDGRGGWLPGRQNRRCGGEAWSLPLWRPGVRQSRRTSRRN